MISILKREWLLATRSGGGLGQSIVFFVITCFLGAIATKDFTQETARGFVWIALMLATLLSQDQMLRRDVESGVIHDFRHSEWPMAGIIAAKTAAHWLGNALPMIILTYPILKAFQIPAGPTIFALFLGTPALSAIGVMTAALTLAVRSNSLLLAIITLPMFLPTLIFGLLMSNGAPEHGLMLGGLSIISMVVGPILTASIIQRLQG